MLQRPRVCGALWRGTPAYVAYDVAPSADFSQLTLLYLLRISEPQEDVRIAGLLFRVIGSYLLSFPFMDWVDFMPRSSCS
jgi:hypothetical protein